jgi:hypothetical protein
VRFVFAVAIAVLLIGTSAIAAEMPMPFPEKTPVGQLSPPIFLQDILHHVLRDSGQIFSGTVLQVDHNAGSSSAFGTTNIRFHVEQAIRGVRKGQVLEIKEWGGLWQSGERYHPGERVLLFLYPPSKLGLTSPVGHGAGRFSVDIAGNVLVKTGFGRPEPIAMKGLMGAIRMAEGK